MKIVFLDAETLGEDVSFEAISALGEYVPYPRTAPDQVIERSLDADVIISNKVYIGQKEMDALPCLKLICVAATGMNNIDLDCAAAKGIPVRNAINYSTESVAQVTFMHILNLVGKAEYFDAYCKNGLYSTSGCFTNVLNPFFELKGRRMGVIGLGNIGGRVASIASAFGMKVSYYATSGKPHSELYPAVSLDELLRESDIISVHCPLNPSTKDLVGYQELRKMKRSAFIVNMGRGGIITEEALAKALDEGLIAGAAVDVFSIEPLPTDHPYLTMTCPDRLRLTPHIGWASRQARVCLIEKIAQNIREVLG